LLRGILYSAYVLSLTLWLGSKLSIAEINPMTLWKRGLRG
jgi:hypothetical protein